MNFRVIYCYSIQPYCECSTYGRCFLCDTQNYTVDFSSSDTTPTCSILFNR